MATLPDASALGERPRVQPSMGAAAIELMRSDPNAGFAAEVRGAGREMDQAASIIDATNAEQDRIAAEAGLNALQQHRMTLEFDPKKGFKNAKEGAAVGQEFADTFMGQFNDAQASISERLLNDRQRKLFAERAPMASLQYRSALMQHQATQTEAFNDSTANHTLELSLRGMAQRPSDELGFQTGMVRINSTIDDFAKRKGLPKEQVDAMKGKYLDAAYSARIMSVLEGVPGVVESNPYLAEQMLRQMSDQMGPQAIMHLGKAVLSGVKDVQMRDGAKAEVFGGGAMDARSVYPAIEGVKPLTDAPVQTPDTGGRTGGSRSWRNNNPGNIRDSDFARSSGAIGSDGAFAIFPDYATGRKAQESLIFSGSGYKDLTLSAAIARYAPASDNNDTSAYQATVLAAVDGKDKRMADYTPEERVVILNAMQKVEGFAPGTQGPPVDRGLAGAMTARYGDPALVLASYKAGPSAVDSWLAKYGDPRTGAITVDEWLKKIPFSETRDYVMQGLKKIAAAGGASPTTPVSGPTANQIKAEAIPALLDRARAHAEAMYPNDPKFVDGYVARTLQNANQVLGAQRAQQDAARDTLTQALVGSKGDGSDAVKTIDQAMADPTIRAAFETATPDAKLAFQTRLAKGDQRWDQSSFGLYYQLQGMAADRPSEFVDVDLTKHFGAMPDSALKELTVLQRSISSKDAKARDHDLNWARAKADVDFMLKPLGLGTAAKSGDKTKQQKNDDFYGRLNEALLAFKADPANGGKYPSTPETQKIAASLLTPGAQKGTWFGLYDSDIRPFEVKPEDMGKFYIPLPSSGGQERLGLTQAFQRVHGRTPTDAELQNYWTAYQLAAGGKAAAPKPVAPAAPRRRMSGVVTYE